MIITTVFGLGLSAEAAESGSASLESSTASLSELSGSVGISASGKNAEVSAAVTENSCADTLTGWSGQTAYTAEDPGYLQGIAWSASATAECTNSMEEIAYDLYAVDA
ncbi:hypothetical protein [Streptomyces prunicolor]